MLFTFIAMIIQILNQHYIEIFFLTVSDDAIFATFTTLFILAIGYLINRYNEHRKEVKRLNDLEEYFYALFELLKQPINKQIHNLKEMADNIDDKKKNQFECKLDVGFDASNLLKIAHSDLYKIFMVRKIGEVRIKTEHFTNMTNTLNYINYL